MKKEVTGIIVKGEWKRDNSISFQAVKGFYPLEEDGTFGLFTQESILETGTTSPIEFDTEDTFFKEKFKGQAEHIFVNIL